MKNLLNKLSYKMVAKHETELNGLVLAGAISETDKNDIIFAFEMAISGDIDYAAETIQAIETLPREIAFELLNK